MSIEMLDEPSTTALTVQHRAAMALNSSKTEADLTALALKNVHIVAVVDKAGRQQAHGAAMELRTARTTIAKVSKDARDDATQFQRAVIAEEKRLIALVEPEENRLIGLRDAWDEEQERIKREAEAKERARITAIHERISEIRGFAPLAAQCRTAIRVDDLLVKLQDFDMEGFEEFSEEAATVHAAAVSGVTFIRDEKQAEEAERARVKAQQEADAAALKQAQEKQAAEAAALAAERAALEKERAELAAAKAQQAAIQMRDEQAAREAREEQELAAYKAALNAAPVVDAEIDSAPVAAPAPVLKAPTRPTDMEIVEVLALHYRVHESKVLDWLLAMDLNAVTEAIAAEFA